MTAAARVALATCAELPQLDADDRPLVGALAEHGVDGVPAVWDDEEVDWQAFELVVLRSTWDYAERRDAFLTWAASVPRLANPIEVVRWNTDKAAYLRDLAQAGVPIIPATMLEPGRPVELPDPPLVVKPAVSAGGRRSGRFDTGETTAAHELVAKIHADKGTAIVQPYLAAAERGETALVFIDGCFSHALGRRVPLPRGGSLPGLYLEEHLTPRSATPAERRVADAALAAVPGGAGLLYARVDVIDDGGGNPLVAELELTEPSLYLAFGEGAADRLARAISGQLVRVR